MRSNGAPPIAATGPTERPAEEGASGTQATQQTERDSQPTTTQGGERREEEGKIIQRHRPSCCAHETRRRTHVNGVRRLTMSYVQQWRPMTFVAVRQEATRMDA